MSYIVFTLPKSDRLLEETRSSKQDNFHLVHAKSKELAKRKYFDKVIATKLLLDRESIALELYDALEIYSYPKRKMIIEQVSDYSSPDEAKLEIYLKRYECNGTPISKLSFINIYSDDINDTFLLNFLYTYKYREKLYCTNYSVI